MKSHAKVVVIGGGVVGCSVLYHLTKFGWTDVVLLERSELTSGSTWHAAGGMHTINGDPNVAKLQKYTVELYKEIEDYSGQDIGLHMTSGLMLAATSERFDWMKSLLAKGKYAGGEGRSATVTLGMERDPQWMRIVVTDNGPGIPEEKREQATERFVRLEESRSQPGSGLGLSLAKAVMKLHGGALRLEDNGPGLRAVLEFPLSKAEAQQ